MTAPITYQLNTAQRGDALDLLRSLPSGCTPLVLFDPQYRGVLDHLKLGNEGARQQGRAKLPPMTDDYIEACNREIARALRPNGYLLLWADAYNLLEAHHLRVKDVLKAVGAAAWDNLRMSQGNRFRCRGSSLIALQKLPIRPPVRWKKDRGIPDRWAEKIDLKRYPPRRTKKLPPGAPTFPHAKPFQFIKRLIACLSNPDDLIVDPAAGSFTTMHAAHALGRRFIGCDLFHGIPLDSIPVPAKARKRTPSSKTADNRSIRT
jgi:site-specific DNA-methyltransferase (adenine-specific)